MVVQSRFGPITFRILDKSVTRTLSHQVPVFLYARFELENLQSIPWSICHINIGICYKMTCLLNTEMNFPHIRRTHRTPAVPVGGHIGGITCLIYCTCGKKNTFLLCRGSLVFQQNLNVKWKTIFKLDCSRNINYNY